MTLIRARNGRTRTESAPPLHAPCWPIQGWSSFDDDPPAAPTAAPSANRSATVLGVSNVFGEGGTELWNDVVAAIPSRFRRLPLVGYERGDDLVHCLAAGFEQMGGLSVWQR